MLRKVQQQVLDLKSRVRAAQIIATTGTGPKTEMFGWGLGTRT